jgi:hypothetical protein
LKRIEPNMLLAVTTVLALALVVVSACLYAAPETALKYVAVALACSVGFVFLNRAFMKARKRQPRTLINPEQPGVMIFAAIFPMVVLMSAALPLLAPNADYGLMIIIAAVFTGVTVESALEARRRGLTRE